MEQQLENLKIINMLKENLKIRFCSSVTMSAVF